jgi:hypothetical protein
MKLAPSSYLNMLLNDKFTILIFISPAAYSETGCSMVLHEGRRLGNLWRSVPQTMENDRPKFLVMFRYIYYCFFSVNETNCEISCIWETVAALRQYGGQTEVWRFQTND